MSKDHWPKQSIELQPSAEARQEEKETVLLVKGEELEEEAITPNHLINIFGHILSQLPDIPDDTLEEEDALTRMKCVEQKIEPCVVKME